MPREAITQPASRIEAWADQVIGELMADIPATDSRARLERGEKIVAEIEFEISRRALGWTPAVFHPDVVAAGRSDFHRLVADLEEIADAAPESVRIIAANVREYAAGRQRADAPDSMAMLAAVAMFALKHDIHAADDGLADVAEFLGLRLRDLRWAGRYIRITLRRLKRAQPELHEALIVAIENIRDQLLRGVGDTRYFRGPGATLSVGLLFNAPMPIDAATAPNPGKTGRT